MTETSALQAVWTPWAEVLCPACNNKHAKAIERGVVVSERRLVATPDWQFPCDECGTPVTTQYEQLLDLLLLRARLVGQKRKPAMEQTGGMCMALTEYYDAGEGPRAIVATCMDQDDGYYVICVYPVESDEAYGWTGGQDPIEECFAVSLDAAYLFWLGAVCKGDL